MSASIQESVRAVLNTGRPVVLAVSGGLDSSVLLDAAAATADRDRVTIATFNHGTGPAADRAVAFVAERARELRIRCVVGVAERLLRSEAELRDARWSFLRLHARAIDANVCTAHSLDDQIETILMRAMRGAGARGLAGVSAPSPILRPLLVHRRAAIAEYARDRGLFWVEDPSNASPAFLRNRIRHDLLPAMRAVRPSIDDELLLVGEQAAAWRAEVETVVDAGLEPRVLAHGAACDVRVNAMRDFADGELAVLWPAIVGRAGLALDRRALARLVPFTRQARVGARIQLAGGWQVVRSREDLEFRRSDSGDSADSADATDSTHAPTQTPIALSNDTRCGDWVFRQAVGCGDAWSAWLPADVPLLVRRWRAGDRLATDSATRERKVKEMLTDAGVTGHRRTGWPVVLAGGSIIWIPGVGRSEAATAQSGRPGLPFTCEYISR